MKSRSRETDEGEEGFELPGSSSTVCWIGAVGKERYLTVRKGNAGLWQQGWGWVGIAAGPVGHYHEEPSLRKQ